MPEQLKLPVVLNHVNTESSSPGAREALNSADAASVRVQPAWRAWLEALASDAEAALGAALAYQTLDAEARVAVLDVLEGDAARLDVPRVAVFAPLLSVEQDEQRRERIRLAMGDDIGSDVGIPARALMGLAKNGDRVIVAELHLYLDFVRLTICRINPNEGVRWVRNEPLMNIKDTMKPGHEIENVELDPVPLSEAIDLIARAVVAQRRRDGTLPETLSPLVELFDARYCDPREDIE